MIRIAALYKFTKLVDYLKYREPLSHVCNEHGVKGTLLLAAEGINGTIAGLPDGIEAVLAHIRQLPGCAELDVKDSFAAEMPFYRMKVRLKREIVTMGEPDIDPLEDVGHYVAPENWNALIAEPGTIVIDTRNDYEVAVGTFTNAINPETATFRDFPAWFRSQRDTLINDGETPKIAMFCTGGIRCEKATAFLKSEGLDDVYHLKGGILKYLETVPPAESLWQGECFVFDQRVTVTHGLAPGTHGLCHGCRRPVSEADQASPLFVEGVSCPACHDERGEHQRAAYAERQRQTELAAQRGEAHVGATYSRRQNRD